MWPSELRNVQTFSETDYSESILTVTKCQMGPQRAKFSSQKIVFWTFSRITAREIGFYTKYYWFWNLPISGRIIQKSGHSSLVLHLPLLEPRRIVHPTLCHVMINWTWLYQKVTLLYTVYMSITVTVLDTEIFNYLKALDPLSIETLRTGTRLKTTFFTLQSEKTQDFKEHSFQTLTFREMKDEVTWGNGRYNYIYRWFTGME